jgi:membrane-associated phospholipid phosphatase
LNADRALLHGGLLCLAAFLVLTLFVTQQRFDSADRAARALVHQTHRPELLSFMMGASFLGGQPGQVAVVALAFVVLWPRCRRWAVALPLVMAGVGVVQLFAKWTFDRPRPNLDPWGFPSAHVLSLVVLGGYLAYVVGIGSARRGRWRLAVGACVVIVGTVAYSRMYLDAHYLSDVLGGFTAGLVYLCAAIWTIGAVPEWAALRAMMLASPTDTLLVPAPAGTAAVPVDIATTAVAMTPATSVADAS